MHSVDVVIPCYRYGRFLRECVASVLEQGGVKARCLIIDDASGDGSAEIAAAIAAEDPRVQFLIHPKNRGHIATYNEGIEWATADYFLLLSADDLVTPGSMLRAVTVMEENPNVTMTHGAEVVVSSNQPRGDIEIPQTNEDWTILTGADFIRRTCQSVRNEVGTSTAIVRTAAQKQVGGYRKELPHSGDLEMWMRLASLGDVAETAAYQGIRRVHGSNMSVAQFGAAASDFKQLIAAFDSFFNNEGRSVADATSLWQHSRRRLAERFFLHGLQELRARRLTNALTLTRMAICDQPSILMPTRRRLFKLLAIE